MQDDGTINCPSDEEDDEEVGADDDEVDEDGVDTAVQGMMDKAQHQAAVSVRTGDQPGLKVLEQENHKNAGVA